MQDSISFMTMMDKEIADTFETVQDYLPTSFVVNVNLKRADIVSSKLDHQRPDGKLNALYI